VNIVTDKNEVDTQWWPTSSLTSNVHNAVRQLVKVTLNHLNHRRFITQKTWKIFIELVEDCWDLPNLAVTAHFGLLTGT
jgi:hypothetical protein